LTVFGLAAAGDAARGAEALPASRADAAFFAALYDRHAAQLYRYASRRVGEQTAEDLVADTFLAAFQGRERYDPSHADARPWLFGILTRKLARHHRAEKARHRALARSASEAVAEGPDERVAARVTAAAVRARLGAAISRLSQGDRDVLLLVAWCDFSYEEVAAALGIPLGTVRSRLNRARRKVRDALGGIDPTVDPTVHPTVHPAVDPEVLP
jgi:RNA polymerase sigma-70 factor (ECF subfamily)